MRDFLLLLGLALANPAFWDSANPVTCEGGVDPDAEDYVHRAATVRGGKGGVDGVYYEETPSLYTRTDGSWQMEWNGCSWVFGRAIVEANIDCVDDIEAANSLFLASEEDDLICQSGAAANFCDISYFKAVCANSCSGVSVDTCHTDNDAAAEDLATALELAQTTCAQLEGHCNIKSVAAVCKKTCQHPDFIRDNDLYGVVLLRDWNDAYNRRLFRWGDNPGRDPHIEGRMLAKPLDENTISFVDRLVYLSEIETLEHTFDFLANYNTDANYTSTHAFSCFDQNDEAMNASHVCDPKDIMTAVKEAKIEFDCSKLTGYDTHFSAYCPWINIDVPSDTELSMDSCYANQDRSGFDNDNINSNALCVPRERCEELCTARDNCIGVDLVLGKDRCFLNREHEDLCSEDTVYTGTGGLEPQDGWYHPDGYGTTPGDRYPDLHIPSGARARKLNRKRNPRRLAGQQLWKSNSHAFLRKSDADTVWKTTSDTYCQSHNIDLGALQNVAPFLCESVGGDHAEGLNFDFVDAQDVRTGDVVFCGNRNKCEELCKSLPDCAGFDMHQTLDRCWLNTASCTTDDITRGATEHDLVTKVQADACRVTISGAGAGDAEGMYFQTAHTDLFVHQAMTHKIEYEQSLNRVLPHSGWWYVQETKTYGHSKLPFAIGPWAIDNQAGDIRREDDGFTWSNWTEAELLHAACPDTGIEVLFKCLGDEMCHTLGYCMLSDERMSHELNVFREGDDLTEPICRGRNGSRVGDLINQYKPKIIADKYRLEYVIDSEQFDGSTDSHFLHQEIYRDSSDFRVRLQSLGESFAYGLVTMVEPNQAAGFEFGSAMLPPAGYHEWQTDLMRFERFNTLGENIMNESFTFEMYTDSDTAVTLFLRGDGEWIEMEEGSNYTIEQSEIHDEEGWWLVTVLDTNHHGTMHGRDVYSECSIIIAGTKDIDECASAATYDCEENAQCVNVAGGVPGYECVCKDGWRAVEMHGEMECVATKWTAEALAVRIENDEQFDLGWRVQEIELFSDGKCENKLIEDGREWYWVKLDDTYCLGRNYVSIAAEADTCGSKCSAQSADGDCAGYMNGDSAASPALCVSSETCMAYCGMDDNCAGIDMHEFLPRCYLNSMSSTSDDVDCHTQAKKPELRMTDVHYDLWMKDQVVSVTSASAFTHHPVDLVHDGSMNSEWWSGTFRSAPLVETIDFRVSAFASVLGVRVHQKEGHAVSKYRVHVGPADRGVLDTPGKHVQHAEAGATIEDRSQYTKSQLVTVREGESPCIDLTCGMPILAWSNEDDILQRIPDAPSACHCKQLCLDQVDEGCRSYMHYAESDTNYWSDEAYHVHKTCYLLITPFNASKGRPSPWAISGGIDLVLHGFRPDTAPAGKFDLTVSGAGLPVQTTKQRIKVVHESCDEAPAAEVVGVSCSSPYVCHPPPASADGDEATWSIEIVSGKEEKDYKVCYCAGVCFSAGQWTLVPGKITVPAATFTFTVDLPCSRESWPGEPCPGPLTRFSDDFYLDFEPALTRWSGGYEFGGDPVTIHFIPAYEHGCTQALIDTHDDNTGISTPIITGNRPSHELSEFAVGATPQVKYGDYIVCIRRDASGTLSYEQASQANGPYLTVHPHAMDAQRTAGIFRGAGSWSVKAGKTAAITIGGTDLAWADFSSARVAIPKDGLSCNEVSRANYRQNMREIAATQSKSNGIDELVFEIDTHENMEAGEYDICFCADDVDNVGNDTIADTPNGCAYEEFAGKLYVTRRVDTGKNWVVDPESNASSIELTGENLDWNADRVMVVNCHDQCGSASGSEYVHGGDAWAGKKAMPDNLNPYNQGGAPAADEPFSVDGLYMEIDNSYCRANNIGEGDDLLTTNLCFDKCKDGCVGEECFCDGYYEGFDTDASAALCLPRVECTHLCTLLGDACWGVDMHKENNRCFLQGPGCQAQQDATEDADGFGFDTSYKLLVKPASGARRLSHIDWASSRRGNLVLNPGVSTPYKLRFTDINFKSAGTFKVCFCDSSNGGGCATAADFRIEVGKVHVSGVSCLLSVPKLRAVKCYEQYYGGLSCADDWTEAPADASYYPNSHGNLASP